MTDDKRSAPEHGLAGVRDRQLGNGDEREQSRDRASTPANEGSIPSESAPSSAPQVPVSRKVQEGVPLTTDGDASPARAGQLPEEPERLGPQFNGPHYRRTREWMDYADALLARCAELAAAVEEMRERHKSIMRNHDDMMADYINSNNSLHRELELAEARLAEAGKDAARYRDIAEQTVVVQRLEGGFGVRLATASGLDKDSWHFAKTLSEAIDAAKEGK